ncbi:MAG: glycosyltransferase family 2 protein [Bacteroides sp.]|nr:glycosyltransferase family 2 protein [Bacteroides sp.]
MKKLSVIIPCYNEANTIGILLEKIIHVNLPNGVELEVIVIDDGSTDNTPNCVHCFISVYAAEQLHYIRLCKNRGKGFAVRQGIKRANGDFIVIQDADLEYDPADYATLLYPLLKGTCKVVYGSRILNRKNRHSYVSFYWGGLLLSFLVSILYGQRITDESTGYKMFDAALLKSIPLTNKGFGFCPEVTAKVLRLGHCIKEVPIGYSPRSKAEGKKIKWQDGIEAACLLLKYRFDNKWLKYYETREK